ncbi:MAG: malonyl-CoA decarboxylase domain-containing protein, partial [Alphaproteobacteria bacterium]
EAVHEIRGWHDLRRRLADDRRCFAYFHPALPEEPLIFVEVALTRGIATAVQPLLDITSLDRGADDADTAIFYSISNCQTGLDGISFGNFLIKQVVDHLSRELPQLKTFATLSPIPGFATWLAELSERETDTVPVEALQLIDEGRFPTEPAAEERLKAALIPLCARYLIQEKRDGLPIDPVARFHLGNGSSIEQINWLADRSENGLRNYAGVMVNFLYEKSRIVENHEAYSSQGEVAVSAKVRKLLTSRLSAVS